MGILTPNIIDVLKGKILRMKNSKFLIHDFILICLYLNIIQLCDATHTHTYTEAMKSRNYPIVLAGDLHLEHCNVEHNKKKSKYILKTPNMEIEFEFQKHRDGI